MLPIPDERMKERTRREDGATPLLICATLRFAIGCLQILMQERESGNV